MGIQSQIVYMLEKAVEQGMTLSDAIHLIEMAFDGEFTDYKFRHGPAIKSFQTRERA